MMGDNHLFLFIIVQYYVIYKFQLYEISGFDINQGHFFVKYEKYIA